MWIETPSERLIVSFYVLVKSIPSSYFACYQIALEYLGIGMLQQRQMSDREEQQQKAQLHRVPSARRPCNERSSAHNYRDRYGRTLSAAKRPLWSILPGAMTCISIWLFARNGSTFAKLLLREKKKKEEKREDAFVFCSKFRAIVDSSFRVLFFSFSVPFFLPNM